MSGDVEYQWEAKEVKDGRNNAVKYQKIEGKIQTLIIDERKSIYKFGGRKEQRERFVSFFFFFDSIEGGNVIICCEREGKFEDLRNSDSNL